MSGILDFLVGGVLIIGFGIAVLVAFSVYTNLGDTGLFGSYKASFDGFWTSINNIAIFIVLGMSMAAILSAFLIKEHPAFFLVSLILVFVIALVVPALVNSFNSVAASTSMAAGLAKFDLLIPLIDRLPLITIIGSLIAAVAGLARG